MCKLRDVVIFLAGAAFFHTINHIVLPHFMPLPAELGFMTLTASANMWIIIVSAVVTLALLWIAKRL